MKNKAIYFFDQDKIQKEKEVVAEVGLNLNPEIPTAPVENVSLNGTKYETEQSEGKQGNKKMKSNKVSPSDVVQNKIVNLYDNHTLQDVDSEDHSTGRGNGQSHPEAGNGNGQLPNGPPPARLTSGHDEMGNSSSNKTRLIVMFSLTFGFFLVEIIFGYISNSMALVADSFHMLSDVAALVVAFISVKMSPKKWSKNTFGWARAEVLGALVNAVFLVALCFSILVESVKRFITPDEIHYPVYVLGVGIAGLVVNLIGIFLFHNHGGSGHAHHHTIKHQSRLTRMVATDDNENDERVTSPENAPPAPLPPPPPKVVHGHSHSSASQMNMRGVFLHLLADALGSVIVIISALIIWLSEWEYKLYVDPALSVLMVFLILNSVWPLLQESAMILLQTVPTHIQVDDLENRLVREVEGVLAVHEFHIWQLAGDRIIASAHIRCQNLADYVRVAERVKEFFHNEGIHSTTIQPEFVEQYPDTTSTNHQDCRFSCPPASETAESGRVAHNGCIANSCCGPQQRDRLTQVVTT